MIRLAPLFLVALACHAAPAKTPPEAPARSKVEAPASRASQDDATERGRAIVAQIKSGECAALWMRLSEPMQKTLKTEEHFVQTCQQVVPLLAAESELVDEQGSIHSNLPVYVRKIKTEAGAGLKVTIAWDAAGKIAGLAIAPLAPTGPAPSKYDEYQSKTSLRLPFTGTWTVFWGGRTLLLNYHVAHPSQHFAYDLLVLKDGLSHRGEGTQNSEYFCFGEDIVSAGKGQVIEVVTGVADNIPGQMNAREPTGNHVIVGHGDHEFALYGHLQFESTLVKVGDRVEQGTKLGKCGNSGNSSEAHLHFHLQ
ncbi:MAG: M23 family metallopeptidase, partial [Myxococcales bacterium]|nr:M23 family metallopeptidase [Myxococcales bacterium]